MGATDGNGYWFLRRAEAIFREVTQGVDLTRYHEEFDATDADQYFRDLYADLRGHGFRLRPFDEAKAYARSVRRHWGPAMEYLIDELECPRGFWSIDSTIESWSAGHDLAYSPAAD